MVERARVRRLPRRVERDRPREALEPAPGELDVGEHERGQARDRAPVAAPVAPPDQDVLARACTSGTSRRRPLGGRAAIRSCVGPIHCPPISTSWPSPRSAPSVRPPTRSRASSTSTSRPARRGRARRSARRSRRRRSRHRARETLRNGLRPGDGRLVHPLHRRRRARGDRRSAPTRMQATPSELQHGRLLAEQQDPRAPPSRPAAASAAARSARRAGAAATT